MPHLLQYVISGNYFGKVKINGKSIRQSLETSVWTTAQLRLNDFLKEHRENRSKVAAPKFSEALEIYERELKAETNMKPRSKGYRLDCIKKLQRTWPELSDLCLDEITVENCKDWATRLNAELSGQYYNNMIGTLRLVIDRGIKAHKDKSGVKLENPANELKRVRIKQRDLKLPEPAHFKMLVENLRKKSGGWGPRVADLIEFLAYSGMRIKSEALWVTLDDVDWTRKEIVVRGDPVTATKNGEIRRVPMIHDLETLLTRLKDQLGEIKPEHILQVSRGFESLTRACKEIGIPRLRLLFCDCLCAPGLSMFLTRFYPSPFMYYCQPYSFDAQACLNRDGVQQGGDGAKSEVLTPLVGGRTIQKRKAAKQR